MPELIDWAAFNAEPEVVLATWHLTQLASMVLYEAGDPSSCADGDRRDVQTVRSFLDQGTHALLDIGSGAFALPGYVPASVEHYVGIDPIIPDAEPGFALSNAFAEQLPFRDQTFDCVLFATSLDHVLHVPSALAEARRVLSENGSVVFWGGTTASGSYRELTDQSMHRGPDSMSPSPGDDNMASRDALFARLPGFEARRSEFEPLLLDEYHIRHFSVSEVIECFAAAGMAPMRFEPIVVDQQLAGVLLEFKVVDQPDHGLAGLARTFEVEQQVAQGLAATETARLQLLDSFQTALQDDRNANAEYRTEAANAIAGLEETTKRTIEQLESELAALQRRLTRLESQSSRGQLPLLRRLLKRFSR